MNLSWLMVFSLGVLYWSFYPKVHAELLKGAACPVGNAPAAMHCPGNLFTLVTYNVSTDPLDTSKRYLHTACVNLVTMCSVATEAATAPSGSPVNFTNVDTATPITSECDSALSLCDSKCPEPTIATSATDPTPVAAPGLVSLCCPNPNGIVKTKLRCAILNVGTLSTTPGGCAGV